jgi:hypothetical protein
VFGDEAQEFVDVEPRHDHQVVPEQQARRRGREAGVVTERHGQQVDVILGHAEREADQRRYSAVPACIDQLRTPRAATGGHRLPHRRHRLRQRCVREVRVRHEIGWHAWYFAAWIGPADDQRTR